MDSLRYSWLTLHAQASDLQELLLALQPTFEEDLLTNISQFRRDVDQFIHEYHTRGPMVTGLHPREASDRLMMFQV